MANLIGRAARSAALGILASGSFLIGPGCGKQDAAAPSRPPPLVNVLPALAMDVPVYLDEIGKTSARETVTIMPQVTGRIDGIYFDDGDDIDDEQLLFSIDSRPYDAALQQARAQLAKDQAALENAEKFLIRQLDVYRQKFISESDYDTARFAAQGARATVEADKAAVQNAKLNVEYCYITCPINGRAGMRQVDPGNIVTNNTTPLLVLQRLNPIYADFTINERELADVRAHMADHTLEAIVMLPGDADAGTGRVGDLTFLDNAVQDSSGTVRLRATLKNLDRHFWPGQFVNVRLVLMTRKDAVLIPLSAPQLGQQGTYVYVINGTTAELRPIMLGQQQAIGSKTENYVVVESGLKAGERVVVNGQLTVMPGGPVKIDPIKMMTSNEAPATQPAEKKDDEEKDPKSDSATPAGGKSRGRVVPATKSVSNLNATPAVALPPAVNVGRALPAIAFPGGQCLPYEEPLSPVEQVGSAVRNTSLSRAKDVPQSGTYDRAPSPMYSWERVGVRADPASCAPRDFAPHPALSPEYRGEGSTRRMSAQTASTENDSIGGHA